MDFYFTDRQFNLLEIISTDGIAPFKIVDDKETRSITAGSRMLEGTIVYTEKQAKRVSEIGALGNYILYVDEDGRGNFQTIVEITGHNNLTGQHSFRAENSTNDLLNETVDAYSADKAYPIATYINRFTADSGFEIGVNEISNLSRNLKWDSTDETALARILSVATQFDAELDFTFEFTGTRVSHRYINIHKHIGADKDVRLTQNKEINSITTTGDIYDLATAIQAIGGTPEGADKPITLAGYKYTDPTGRYVLRGQTVLDTVANRTWTRLLGGGTPSTTGAYLNRVITYTAVTQAELMRSVLTDLKKRAQPNVNYDVDIAILPPGVDVGDTVHIVDENEELYLSSRILELEISRSTGIITAKLGDYVVEENQVSVSVKDLAQQLKELANRPVYTWIAYADDASGSGISLFANDKDYVGMAVNMLTKETDISDPSRFNWQLTKGEPGQPGKDGTNGTPGAKGADGRTSYFHTAWADSENGSIGFTNSGGNGKKYVGTYSDFTASDSEEPSRYNWALFKGDKGDSGADGVAGKDGVGIKSTTITYATSSSGTITPTSGWISNPPTVNPGQFMWTKTVWNYTDNSNETGYSVAQAGKTGPQGSKGDPGSKDVPVITSGTSFPTTRKTGDMHWMTDSSGVVIGYYKFDGSQWVVQKIDAQSLNVSSLSALSANLGNVTAGTINGVNINGSTYTVPYKHADLDGDRNYTTGSMTISGGKVTIDGNVESEEGVDSGQRYNTTLSPSGFHNYVTSNDGTTRLNEARIVSGMIGLSSIVSGSGNNATYMTSSLDAEKIFQLNKTGRLLWSGRTQLGDNQTITPSLPMTSCLNGWKIGIATDIGNRFSWYHLAKEKAIESPNLGHSIPIFDFNTGGGGMYIYVSNTTLTGNSEINLKGVAAKYYIYEIRAF